MTSLIPSPIFVRPTWLSHEITHAPRMTPQTLPIPPTITMTSTMTEIWNEKLVGKIPLMNEPYRAPAKPPKTAPIP